MNYEGMIVKWDRMWWYVHRQVDRTLYVCYLDIDGQEVGRDMAEMKEDYNLVEDYVDTTHLSSDKALIIACTLEKFE